MTTKEKIAVMQAWLDGEIIQTNSPGGAACYWLDWTMREPNWDWERTDYRIKPTPPKRIFGPKDFPPWTVVRKDHWEDGEWMFVIAVFEKRISVSSGSSYAFTDINERKFANYTFSTESGKTWQRMAP